MNKIDFNELQLIEQIQYINDQLQTGLSLTNICKNIGVDRSTVRKRFKSKGYIFNSDLSLYEEENLNTRSVVKQVKTLNKKPYNNTQNATNTNTLESRVKALETKIKGLEKLINSNEINTKNTNDKKVNIIVFEGETVSRAYRLDAKVQKDFKIFCKKHSEYKVQDIISSALKDFMDKNK